MKGLIAQQAKGAPPIINIGEADEEGYLSNPFKISTSDSSYEFSGLPLREAREAFERHYLFSQVEHFEGNISKTAEFVGMERSALHRKLKSLEKSEVIDFDPQKAHSKAAQ
ncbi:MAG: helix-turn-helix domain-containing protein [Alphaproteobacteria bacterium]